MTHKYYAPLYEVYSPVFTDTRYLLIPDVMQNLGIILTNCAGLIPWQGWHEKWFHPYLLTVCSVSLSISIFRIVLLYFCYSLSASVVLYLCLCVTSLVSPHRSAVPLHRCTLRIIQQHCTSTRNYTLLILYDAGSFQPIGSTLVWKELSNIMGKENYWVSKRKDLTG
jgi:hypothetical protein